MSFLHLYFRYLPEVVTFSAAPGSTNIQEIMCSACAAVIPPFLWFPCLTQRCRHLQLTLCRQPPRLLSLKEHIFLHFSPEEKTMGLTFYNLLTVRNLNQALVPDLSPCWESFQPCKEIFELDVLFSGNLLFLSL